MVWPICGGYPALPFPPNSKEATDVLNWSLESVMGWMRVNKLKLSFDKTKVLWVIESRLRALGSNNTVDTLENQVVLPSFTGESTLSISGTIRSRYSDPWFIYI